MLLLRGATWRSSRAAVRTQFQYMLLLRGATRKSAHLCGPRRFQYMLLLRGATPAILADCLALRFNTCSSCEVQPGQIAQKERSLCLNTCSSCEEQLYPRFLPIVFRRFQYMLLLRGATRAKNNTTAARQGVSIHAPLARSNSSYALASAKKRFQYMLLLRGATLYSSVSSRMNFVSIHAPLVYLF